MKSTFALVILVGLFSFPLLAETPSVAPLLSPFIERGELAGAVALVTDAEGTLSVDCVGWADIESKRPRSCNGTKQGPSRSRPIP
jgi:hypothetical protein